MSLPDIDAGKFGDARPSEPVEGDRRHYEPSGDFGPVTMTLSRRIPGVLRILIRGQGGDSQAAMRRWRHNLAHAQDLGLDKLLVVMELGGPVIGEAGLARMIDALAGEFDMAAFRVALVQTRHDRQAHDERGTLLALEQGISARVFADEGTALLWLRHGAT